MAHQPIRLRKRYPDVSTYLESLIGRMVYALGGNFFGIIRRAEREGRRIILRLESSEGKDVDVWADECSTNEHAARMMRGAAIIGRPLNRG